MKVLAKRVSLNLRHAMQLKFNHSPLNKARRNLAVGSERPRAFPTSSEIAILAANLRGELHSQTMRSLAP